MEDPLAFLFMAFNSIWILVSLSTSSGVTSSTFNSIWILDNEAILMRYLEQYRLSIPYGF